jgi:hypothetical protein
MNPPLSHNHAARRAAELFTLPVGRGSHASTGNIPGRSTGSSIDFQDHRPYFPGDDPRHIDWAAYARSGHYYMKLYRAEVRALVDLAVDGSASMTFPGEKAARSGELLAFCVDAALRAGASVRVHAVSPSGTRPMENAEAMRGFPPGEPGGTPPDLETVPWRAGSLRIWLSDLLYPQPPSPTIGRMIAGNGSAVIFCPHASDESSPDWIGNLELVDTESHARANHYFRHRDLTEYQKAYSRHFAAWSAESRRWGVPLGRVPSTGSFVSALTVHALPVGAVFFVR